MKTLSEMQQAAHANAVAKGFWDGKDPVQTIPESIALMHSELSEALEEYRNPAIDPTHTYFEGEHGKYGVTPEDADVENPKPVGLPSELADVVIRVMDVSAALGIDLEEIVRLKMAYNATRPHRHGGKRA